MPNRTISALALGGLLCAISASSHAVIISTSVSTGMEIRENGVVASSGAAAGVMSAFTSLVGMNSQATASSELIIGGLGPESASLSFALAYAGTGMTGGSNYLGQLSSGINNAVISYQAGADSTLMLDWNFDYFGPNPFGLQIVQVSRDGTVIQTLGDAGNIGNHMGMDTINLLGGSTYDVEVTFFPNVSGDLSNIDGSLVGVFNFAFDPGVVPEPTTLLLLGFGLAGLGFAGRRPH